MLSNASIVRVISSHLPSLPFPCLALHSLSFLPSLPPSLPRGTTVLPSLIPPSLVSLVLTDIGKVPADDRHSPHGHGVPYHAHRRRGHTGMNWRLEERDRKSTCPRQTAHKPATRGSQQNNNSSCREYARTNAINNQPIRRIFNT